MKKLSFLLILLCFVFLVQCATEQKSTQLKDIPQERCEAPVWHENDEWAFIGSDGRQWEEKIVTTTPKLSVRQNPQKQFYGFFTLPMDLFPLWVGKRYDRTQRLETVEHYYLDYFYSFRVEGMVDLQVKAGTIKCYKIVFQVSGTRSSGIAYYYYSPETKCVVKFETTSSIMTTWENYELLSFRVK